MHVRLNSGHAPARYIYAARWISSGRCRILRARGIGIGPDSTASVCDACPRYQETQDHDSHETLSGRVLIIHRRRPVAGHLRSPRSVPFCRCGFHVQMLSLRQGLLRRTPLSYSVSNARLWRPGPRCPTWCIRSFITTKARTAVIREWSRLSTGAAARLSSDIFLTSPLQVPGL